MRKRRAKGKRPLPGPHSTIQLQNPMTDNFPAFIFGNATKCTAVALRNAAKGRSVAICGAGPSLADHAAEYAAKADDVWGCNSAMPWLHDHGHKVTHAFTVDQQPAMVKEWWDAPDVEYLLASTVHPHLTDHLIERGRKITWFHNFVGIRMPNVVLCECGHSEAAHDDAGTCSRCECMGYVEHQMSYEDWLYSALYPSTVRVGMGLNAVTRAIDLAWYMGYREQYILGADCALRITALPPKGARFGSPEHLKWLKESTVMHADGGNALASGATAVTLNGDIDGRRWDTKPDLMITAVWLAKIAKAWPSVHLIGDTLPNALVGKDDAFLDQLPTMTHHDGSPMRIDVPLQDAEARVI